MIEIVVVVIKVGEFNFKVFKSFGITFMIKNADRPIVNNVIWSKSTPDDILTTDI